MVAVWRDMGGNPDYSTDTVASFTLVSSEAFPNNPCSEIAPLFFLRDAVTAMQGEGLTQPRLHSLPFLLATVHTWPESSAFVRSSLLSLTYVLKASQSVCVF